MLLALPLTACSDDSPSTAEDPNANSDLETTDCTYTEDGMPAAKEVELPSSEAVAEGEIAATMTTSIGEFGLTLDAAAAPCTVALVRLAGRAGLVRRHPVPPHRHQHLVLQCGDPTATGTGGPGYSFADELTGEETYTAGTLAMANSGPDTNGSQFFIVYGERLSPPAYTVFGSVDDATVEAVAAAAEAGTDDANGPGDGAPLTEITIESASVE